MKVGLPKRNKIKIPRVKISMEKRFLESIDKKGENECWEYKAGKNQQGYGQLWYDDKNMRAHIVAYMLAYGEIPNGMCVLHHCDRPSCCNPNHLFLGTQQDNVKDMLNKGRGKYLANYDIAEDIRNIYNIGGITQKELSNEFGISQGEINCILQNKQWKDKEYKIGNKHLENLRTAKLTWEKVNEIRQRGNKGEKASKLAKEFDVSFSTINRILKNKIWKNLLVNLL